jgi:Tfp pilus assembly PilM family ATPase
MLGPRASVRKVTMQLPKLLERFQKAPADTVGIEVHDSEMRLVHVKRVAGEPQILAAAVVPLPPAGTRILKRDMPVKLRSKYAAIAAPGENAILKLLTFSGSVSNNLEQRLLTGLGIPDMDHHRLSYRVIEEGHGKQESRVLAVALPETDVLETLKHFSVSPAPYSFEISPLATFSALEHALGDQFHDSSFGVLDFGNKDSTLAMFHNGIPTIVRRFNLGSAALAAKVLADLGVTLETAAQTLQDSAFDNNDSVADILPPLVKQLLVSRDFVERRENCTISRVYISGELSQSPSVLTEIGRTMEIDAEAWDPFAGLTIQPGALPEEFNESRWIFSSALGAALSAMELI